MEKLQLRILLQYTAGATIARFYNREAFEVLNITRHSTDNSQFIEIGDIINYGEEKLIVRNINFKMEENLKEIDFNGNRILNDKQVTCVGINKDNSTEAFEELIKELEGGNK